MAWPDSAATLPWKLPSHNTSKFRYFEHKYSHHVKDAVCLKLAEARDVLQACVRDAPVSKQKTVFKLLRHSCSILQKMLLS